MFSWRRILDCQAFWLNNHDNLGNHELEATAETLNETIALETQYWEDIYKFLREPPRKVSHIRNTNETKIEVNINIDGTGIAEIQTGLGFFDHMLEQVAKHSGMDMNIVCRGDLHIDEHHTIEDVAIALGESMLKGVGDKKRYGEIWLCAADG